MQASPMGGGTAAAWGDQRLPVAAFVRGSAIHTRDAEELRYGVLMHLTDSFAQTERILVTDTERDAYIRHVDADMRARGIATADMRDPQERAAREQVAMAFVRQWKIYGALHAKRGGRVGYQQGGPEPLDALRGLAEDAVARGDLLFRDAALESKFWSYFRTDSIHSFYPPEQAARAFSRAPWTAGR